MLDDERSLIVEDKEFTFPVGLTTDEEFSLRVFRKKTKALSETTLGSRRVIANSVKMNLSSGTLEYERINKGHLNEFCNVFRQFVAQKDVSCFKHIVKIVREKLPSEPEVVAHLDRIEYVWWGKEWNDNIMAVHEHLDEVKSFRNGTSPTIQLGKGFTNWMRNLALPLSKGDVEYWLWGDLMHVERPQLLELERLQEKYGEAELEFACMNYLHLKTQALMQLDHLVALLYHPRE